MRIISRAPLHDFSTTHPRASQPLDAWYRRAKHADWKSPADVKRDYGTADVLPDNCIVFNIGGNNYRLVVRINYHRQAVFIRFIGTHADYDRIDATTI